MPDAIQKNVINIKEGKLRSIRPKRREQYCKHLSMQIDKKVRLLRCDKCQFLIDPFDYCWDLATKSERIEMNIGYMRKELKELQQLKEGLKREIRNLKQRYKRANDK